MKINLFRSLALAVGVAISSGTVLAEKWVEIPGSPFSYDRDSRKLTTIAGVEGSSVFEVAIDMSVRRDGGKRLRSQAAFDCASHSLVALAFSVVEYKDGGWTVTDRLPPVYDSRVQTEDSPMWAIYKAICSIN